MTNRNIKYDYFEFKKLHEEHNGNISRLSMILSKERPTIRNWIKKMKRDDSIFMEGIKAQKIKERKSAEETAKKTKEFVDDFMKDYKYDPKSKDMPNKGLTAELYKRGAMLLHPDKGGDDELFIIWKSIFKKQR